MKRIVFVPVIISVLFACEYISPEFICGITQHIKDYEHPTDPTDPSDTSNTDVLDSTCTGNSCLVIQPGPQEAQDCAVHYSYLSSGGGSWKNHNMGRNAAIAVGTYDDNTVVRSLIRFEMPKDLTSNDIKSAHMVLYTLCWQRKDMNVPLRIDVHKMLRSWKQGEFYSPDYTDKKLNGPTTDGATGVERFWGQQDGSEDWNTPHVGMDDVDATSKVYASAELVYGDQTPWQFDITDLVKEWLDDPKGNHGMLLRSPTDQGIDGKNVSYPDIYSGDNVEHPQLRPKVIIQTK